MIKKNDYMANVGKKIEEYRSKLTAKGCGRDAAQGFGYTAGRIVTACENLFFSLDGTSVCDPVDAMFKGFSAAPGYADVENVASVSVVDISLLSTINSIMGYTAVERAANDPKQTIYFQTAKAVNTAGGFNQGDTVVSPFEPISTAINLGAAAATATVTPTANVQASVEAHTNSDLLPGSVIIRATLSNAQVAVGKDLMKDGVIYWDNGTVCASASVNYATGIVTFTNLADNTVADSIAIAASVDNAAQFDGADTLKIKPELTDKTVKTTPKQIILNTNVQDIAYMNKMNAGLAGVGVNMDYGKRGILQMIEAYTYYIDVMCARKLHEAAVQNTAISTLDLTAYSLAGSEASTKNDVVNGFVIQLGKKLLQQSRRGVTCYVCDMEGAAILGNNPMYFTPNALFDQNLNGMIGLYRGVPVIRHTYFDGKFGANFAFIGALHKSADGAAGPVAFTEYLPPYSVMPAFNIANPGQMAQALFAQNTTDVIVPQLMSYGLIKIA